MTDFDGMKCPVRAREQYSVWFVCLVTEATVSRGGYAEGDLEQSLRDAKTLHGVVVRSSDGASTSDGKTWRRARQGS